MNVEEPNSPSSETKPARVEDILLARLQNEKPISKQLPPSKLAIVLLVIAGLSFLFYLISHKEDKFAENPHKKENDTQVSDSAQMYSKRLALQSTLDSLVRVLGSNPADDQAHLGLANVYYEMEFWQKAKPEYEYYLARHEDDVDARVDYAFTLAQASGDFKASVRQINKALSYQPEHLNALFNGGLLSIRANLDNKKLAIAQAQSYFTRALAAAKKQGNTKMAEQIGQIVERLNAPAEEEK
ncbi:MAG: hypothetical protein WCH46_11170 [bacterium]